MRALRFLVLLICFLTAVALGFVASLFHGVGWCFYTAAMWLLKLGKSLDDKPHGPAQIPAQAAPAPAVSPLPEAVPPAP